jgi:hypothetical protein
MEQSPSWDANSHSSGQDVPAFDGTPKVHYHVHKTFPEVLCNIS